MFSILGGATAFTQWALDQKVSNEHMSVGDKVIFRAASGAVYGMYAYDDAGAVAVNVPNQLLQTAKPIVIELEGHPACRTMIPVNPAEKPDEYDDLYTEADRHDPKDVESRIKALEANTQFNPLILTIHGWENTLLESNMTWRYVVDVIHAQMEGTDLTTRPIVFSGPTAPIDFIIFKARLYDQISVFGVGYNIGLITKNDMECLAIAVFSQQLGKTIGVAYWYEDGTFEMPT